MAMIMLDGEWLCRGTAAGTVAAEVILRESGDEKGWLPAAVPGEVHLDLQRNGVIEDPFYGTNEEATRWVHEQDWWFRRTFTVDTTELANDRVELVCDGLDTFATIYLNGQPVGSADNMLRAYRFDAKPFLRGGDNEILIMLAAPHAACTALAKQHGQHLGGFNFPNIVQARKAQYSCGWDWGPYLTPIGIWKSVKIDCWSAGRLVDVYVRALEITDARATVEISVDLEGTADLPVTVHAGIAPLVGDVAQTAEVGTALTAGTTSAVLRLDIPQPRRWWPSGYGAQERYRAEIEVAGEGFTAYATVTFGLRTVELIRQPDADGESFIIAVNGVPLFCKGANWIPGDQFLPRVTEAYYRKNLALAAQAGMNMLRVWGGGIYETDTFYRCCDELGLLVWQDFPFACGAYPEYSPLRENIVEEATQAIRALRNYPSLVLWCGNNECHWFYKQHKAEGDYGFLYYDEILPRLCAELDPSRPYWNGSPYERDDEPANSETSGDHHSWSVWGGDAHDWMYLFDQGKFISEFGMQSPPTLATLERWIAPEDRQPWSRAMEIHQKMPEKNSRLYRYLALHFPVPADFRPWVYATQANSCLVLQRAIAHWRARKWLTAGTLLWQLNDCWPVSSWALIDYGCRPKPAWYETRRLFAPLFLTIQPVLPPGTDMKALDVRGEWGRLDRAVSLVNDTLEPVKGTVRLRVIDFHGGYTWERKIAVSVDANSAAQVMTASMAELGAFDPLRQVLLAELLNDDGAVLARDICWIAEPKHLALPAQPVAVEQTAGAITVIAHDLALYVEIDAGEGIPSDNFFHLLPGETRTVEISGAARGVSVRSLADLLEKASPQRR